MRRRLVLLTVAAGLAGCARQGAERAAPQGEKPVAVPLAAAAAPPADEPATPRPLPGRGLTTAERTLLLPLFRDSLDYDAVRVIPQKFIPFQPGNVYMTPEGNIYAPGDLYREDFAADSNPYLRAVFVHEVLHVWQHQSGMNLLAKGVSEFLKGGGNYEEAYPYLLAAGRDLLDYGMEQQASMVEDYHLMSADHLSPGRLLNRDLAPAEESTLYAQVLGKFLADPRYARALSAQAVAEQHGEAAKQGPVGTSGCDENVQPPQAAHMCHWRFEPH